jgi:hypothetical protein
MKKTNKLCDRCGELKPIWKNEFKDGVRKRYCKYCWSCQPKSVKPTVNSKTVRTRSPHRSKEEAQYLKQRLSYMNTNPKCQASIPNLCSHNATDVHHKNGRANERLNDTEHWVSVCRSCHDWIHSHPIEARQLNLLI